MKKPAVNAIFIFALFIFYGSSVYAETVLSESVSSDIADDRKINTAGTGEIVPLDASKGEKLTLLFMGDIMGHISQIKSAKQPDGVTYDYTHCFDYIREYISAADIAVANLEVTLAGPPYTGYPRFSSPDSLAAACKNAGIDVLVTANNHSADLGKRGIERTIKVLDSLNIAHTGTFLSNSDRQKKTPLIIEKNNFKIALLNYTSETNGIPVPKPFKVNIINTERIKADIAKAKSAKPDAVILFFHWGVEKQNEPGAGQAELAEICFNAGADIIIGSHPHVLQKSIWENRPGRNKFVVYSLGNFIANQKAPKTDGGQMLQLTLSKDNGITTLSKANYMLSWIYGPVIDRKRKFYILPCKDYENTPEFFTAPEYYNRMKEFISESRKLLDARNKNVEEIK
jgi:poly-gamma-glutamate synthesis protein (capsule biosynthesis protein)